MSSRNWPDDFDGLHVYAQSQWHGTASIAGMRRGLELLREAIDDALALGNGARSVMAHDGEGYYITVHCMDGAAFDKLGNHYEGIEQRVVTPFRLADATIAKERERCKLAEPVPEPKA